MPRQKADNIIALERRIAEAHWTPERSRDVTQSINPMTPAQLQELAPQFNWPLMLSSQGLGNVQTIIVRQTSAIQAEGQLFAETDLQTWKDWLTFHFIRSNAQFLPRAFDEANFDFYSRTLAGIPQQRDRWKRGLGVLNATLGEAVGEIYVRRHFPDTSRRQMTELVGDLRGALEERLRANPWMDEATRTQALAKLAAFDPRIGNPVRFIDYSAMRVDPNDLLGNAQRAAEFQQNLQLSRLPNPVDRSLWAMTPQTINAYYSPLTNQITFPAAILQPPYFNAAGGRSGELWRDRRGDRSRDRPRLRRQWPPLRSAGPSARLVVDRLGRALHGADPPPRRPIFRLPVGRPDI